MTDRFKRFTPKSDNSNEIISADHVNELQTVSESTQKGLFQMRDSEFLSGALFVLNHHRSLNKMWADVFENTAKIDIAKSKNVVFSEPEQAIIFPEGSISTEGVIYSSTYSNPSSAVIKKVLPMVRGTLPAGTEIIFSVSNNTIDWFEPDLSSPEPFIIPTDGSKLKMRATFLRSDITKSPRLEAWAVLYRDPTLEQIEMPDGTKIVIGDPDNTDPTDTVVNIYHRQLLGIGADDHHPQEHAHDGADGSGLVSHASLQDVGEDDHHNKDHQHGVDGIAPVELATDVVGTLSEENLSHRVWTGQPGFTGLYFDPKMGDRLTYVKTPEEETYLFYDLINERLDHTITIFRGVATYEQLLYGPYTDSTGQTNVIFKGTEKTQHDATDDMIRMEIEKLTTPKAVKNLIASNPGSGNTISLTWAVSPEHDIAGYNVYISGGSLSWSRMNTTGLVVSPSYAAVGLTNGVEYQFKVTAVDLSGYESPDSVVVRGTPSVVDLIAPAAPASLYASASGTVLSMVWAMNTEPDIAKYFVYRSSTGVEGTFMKVATINHPATTHADSGLAAGTYYYRVTAIDISGNESVVSSTTAATL